MSHFTQSRRQVLQLPHVLWVMAAAVLAIGAVALVLVLSQNNGSAQPSKPAATSSHTGIRFDGGPEEGTRGLSSITPPAGVRFDGGPEEGTRGAGH
jgi:hypothetical protein